MKQKLIALATALLAAGAGTVIFMNYETPRGDEPALRDMGHLEVVDRSSCSTRACGNRECTVAQNHLTDAGSPCVPRFVACDFRINQRIRNLATDAGVVLGPQKYQRLELVALRCPGVDGGLAFGVPFDDAGWPIYATTVATPTCVRAPLDGGQACKRLLSDGGSRYFGRGNVFPSSQVSGSSCDTVACSVVYGDNPDTDL